MTKTFKLNGLCCAGCAAKIENGISKIQGVEDVSLSFMTTKLTIEADLDEMSRITDEAKKIIKKYEPDVLVIE